MKTPAEIILYTVTNRLYEAGPTQTTELVSLLTRFWAKVSVPKDKQGCWLWTGATNNKGYGKMQVLWPDGKWHATIASRVAWFVATGVWPEQGVLHTCDTPLCMRHSHHFLGSQKDNMHDASVKGRARGGGCNKTHCKRGHLLSGDNVYHNQGRRTCIECRRLRKRKTWIKH